MVTICVWYGDPVGPEFLLTSLLPELFTDPEETVRYIRHPRSREACLVRSDGIVECVPRHAVLAMYAWVSEAGPATWPHLN